MYHYILEYCLSKKKFNDTSELCLNHFMKDVMNVSEFNQFFKRFKHVYH